MTAPKTAKIAEVKKLFASMDGTVAAIVPPNVPIFIERYRVGIALIYFRFEVALLSQSYAFPASFLFPHQKLQLDLQLLQPCRQPSSM